MSTFIAYRCPQCGAKSFDVEPCYVCGGTIDQPEECGVEKRAGFPTVVRDKLAKHFDYGVGCEITSRSQRNAVYAAKGCVPKSFEEYRRQHPTNAPSRKGQVVFYPGQKNRRSSAERRFRYE